MKPYCMLLKKKKLMLKKTIDDSKTIAAKMQKLSTFAKYSASKVVPFAGYSKTHTIGRDSLVR